MELVEAFVKVEMNSFGEGLDKKIDTVSNKLKLDITSALRSYEADNMVVTGLIGRDCKFATVG